MREISVTEIEGVRIGQTENAGAGTGCTVFISGEGMRAGLDVRGGGPASRESQLLNPLMAAQVIHGIVLAGGSAFGLGAANGVMKYLEEHDIGFDVGVTKVPLVVQSDIFDLTVGDAKIRPDAAMGYEAARLAMEAPNYRDGSCGAGCGATVGKIAGMKYCMKSGIGSFAVQLGELKIGAVAAVNALGDIYDWNTGRQIAGLLTEDRKGLRSTAEYMKKNIRAAENKFADNTTVAVVITNAKFDKTRLCKIAGMAHDGYARAISPVHTTADGDSIYAVSVGEIEADQDLAGTLAAEVVGEAVLRAVRHAESAYGYPAVSEYPAAEAGGSREERRDPLAWEEIRTEHIVRDEWIDFRRSAFRFPDGSVFEPYYSYSRRDYVVIVASDTEGNYLCVRQYRQGIREVTTEFPAGGIERKDGKEYGGPQDLSAEDGLAAAKRELREETGYESDEWRALLTVPSNATIADNYAYLFEAKNCRRVSGQSLDETEFLNLRKHSAEEIEALIARGEFQQAIHITAWLLSRRDL